LLKITHVITSLDNGGAEGVLYRLVAHDCGRHVHSVVSLMDMGRYGELLTRRGIQVYTLGMSRGRVRLSGLLKMAKLMRQLEPDVVQTWMYHADLLGGVCARVLRVGRIVWGIRGPFNRRRTSLSTRMVVWLCARLSYLIPNVIVANSEHALKAHVDVGYRRDRFLCIPNGYFPVKAPERGEASDRVFRQSVGVDESAVLLGMIARFDIYKDHAMLFRALKRLQESTLNCVCVLIGPGMDWDNGSLTRLIADQGLDSGVLRLLGARDDVVEVMRALDLHLLSSAAESFPNVLAEAMMVGTPCVTTDVGDAAMIVGDTGWIVPPGDDEAFANAIHAATREMRDNSRWAERRARSRERITNQFGFERMRDAFAGVWVGSIDE
jgi:glycosyltransferase involved in cell wall biosynthesis